MQRFCSKNIEKFFGEGKNPLLFDACDMYGRGIPEEREVENRGNEIQDCHQCCRFQQAQDERAEGR